MAGTTIVAVRRPRRPGPDRREPGRTGIRWSSRRVSCPTRPRLVPGTRPGGRSQMGGRSSPHLSSRSGPSSSSTPGSEHGRAQRDRHEPGPTGRGLPSRAACRSLAIAPARTTAPARAIRSAHAYPAAACCSGHSVCSGHSAAACASPERPLSVPRWRGRAVAGETWRAPAGCPAAGRGADARGRRRARSGRARVWDGGARGRRVPGQLRGRAPSPIRCRLRSRADENAATGKGPARRCPRLGGLAGQRSRTGLEARTACAAVARLGRAQGPTSRLRRQRGRPGSVRLTRGRGHGTGARPRAGGRGRGRGLRLRGSLVCGAWGTGTRNGAGIRSGGSTGSARSGSLAGLVTQGLPGLPGRGAFLGGEPTATGWRAETIRRGARRRARELSLAAGSAAAA